MSRRGTASSGQKRPRAPTPTPQKVLLLSRHETSKKAGTIPSAQATKEKKGIQIQIAGAKEIETPYDLLRKKYPATAKRVTRHKSLKSLFPKPSVHKANKLVKSLELDALQVAASTPEDRRFALSIQTLLKYCETFGDALAPRVPVEESSSEEESSDEESNDEESSDASDK